MVSVLINNYNYEKFIGEAIESVLNQTYQDFELIIVDDGSNDNSRNIILDYLNKHPDKITVVFKPNGGQASAFNVGYKLAKGDIIAFLDSDDYWYKDKLETIVKYHKEYDFIGHDKVYTDNKDDNQNLKIFDKKYEQKRSYFFKKYGHVYVYNITTSVMSFNKSLLDKILPMPENNYRISADLYLMLFGLYYTNIKYIYDKLAYYRIHGNNAWYTDLNNKENNTNMIFLTLQKLNNTLLERQELPIPYINKYLLKSFCETECNFRLEKDKKYVIYGTGEYAEFIKKYLKFCDGNLVYYCDSNSNKWGKNIDGTYIISPNDLISKRDEYYKIIIASMWVAEISNTLNNLGLKKETDYIYSELEFFCM